MKIAHVVFRARYSGAEILARDLALHQARFGYETSIISVEPPELSFNQEIEDLLAAGVGFHSPLSGRRGAILRSMFLNQVLKEIGPDIIIAHSILPSLYSRATKLLGRRFKLATVLHSNSDFVNPLLRWSERLMHGLNEVVITVSPEASVEYIRYISPRRPPVTIPNGIDLEKFAFRANVRDRVRRELKLNSSDVAFIQIGRICEQKQQLLTLNALRSMNAIKFQTPIKVFFAGTVEPQPYAEQFLDAIKDPLANVDITFLGPRSDVAELLMACDICIMPSAWEAHPIVALEAAASGIHLILSDISAFAPLLQQAGVYSFNAGSSEALGSSITRLLRVSCLKRFERNLSEYALDRCALGYSLCLGLKSL